MFWGLAIEPGKRYMQTVAKSFHLSMACLELNNHDNEAVSLMLDYENQEYVLCNLHRHKVMQCQLDLNFQAGEKIAFHAAGKSRVHLTGFLVDEDEMELSDEEEEDEEVEEVSELSLLKQSPGKKRKESALNTLSSKKQKLEAADDSDEEDDDDDMDDTFQDLNDDEDEDDDEEEEEDDDDNEDDDDEEDSDGKQTPEKKLNKSQQNKMQSENQKRKENQGQTPKTPTQNGQTPQSGKKNKNKQGSETPKSAGGDQSQKKILSGGVVVNDIKVGNGPIAKPGRQVTVYYVGKLKQNNKQFDATNSGPGFKFTLGRGEVIKGWDVGVAGMKVGGKRVITVPPQMAYGKRGQPPVIPPNSALVFEVELKSTN